jgi:hypothetical protein
VNELMGRVPRYGIAWSRSRLSTDSRVKPRPSGWGRGRSLTPRQSGWPRSRPPRPPAIPPARSPRCSAQPSRTWENRLHSLTAGTLSSPHVSPTSRGAPHPTGQRPPARGSRTGSSRPSAIRLRDPHGFTGRRSAGSLPTGPHRGPARARGSGLCSCLRPAPPRPRPRATIVAPRDDPRLTPGNARGRHTGPGPIPPTTAHTARPHPTDPAPSRQPTRIGAHHTPQNSFDPKAGTRRLNTSPSTAGRGWGDRGWPRRPAPRL